MGHKFLSLLMRLVKEIPHSHYFIQIHEYNGKYILKVSLDQYEQVFKFPVAEIENLDTFVSKLNGPFWSSCLNRFLTMREDEAKYLR